MPTRERAPEKRHPTGRGTSEDGLCGVLHAAGPTKEHARGLMLFGQFVGSWRADWTWTTDDGVPQQLGGEVHFGWILGGRAIQDTWSVPAREEWADADPPHGFYGTTIRFYDPSLRAWRSTWINPPSGLVRRFIARPTDREIVLLSDEESPMLRWRFGEITPDAFRWQGEIKRTDFPNWELQDDARLHRYPTTNHKEDR
jgi:hypothetical protein